MIVNLHGLLIELNSQDKRVRQQWRTFFDYELTTGSQTKLGQEADIVLQVNVTTSVLQRPKGRPFYISSKPPLDVYIHEDHFVLIPYDQIQIRLNIADLKNPHLAQEPDALVSITPFVLENGSFEDVITLALAPFLRRKGFFMVHAFTTAVPQQAVMFSGPRGSGKTTAGLALVTAGWQLLANDVALLRENGAIAAALSPGTVHASPKTMTLLPKLARIQGTHTPHPYHGKIAIPRLELLRIKKPDLGAQLKIVYFPQVGQNGRHQITNLPRAVGLARLMEASMDQWDQSTWNAHIDFLERLSRQVTFRRLILGSDLSTLPQLLEEDLRQL